MNLMLSPRTTVKRKISRHRLESEDLKDLEVLDAWIKADPLTPSPCRSGQVMLLASFLPLPYGLKVEGMIAKAMQMRGYQVVVLTNLVCQPIVEAYYGKTLGFKTVLLENYLRLMKEKALDGSFESLLTNPENALERIRDYRYRGAFIGQHALATLSASAVDGKVDLGGVHKTTFQKLLRLSVLNVDAAFRVIEEFTPRLILGIEKGFVGTAEILYAAMESRVDYVQWVACHEPNSVMLKRYKWNNFRDHPFSLSKKSWDKVLSLPWSQRHSRAILDQFERGYKDGDWFKHKYFDLTGEQQHRNKQELFEHLRLDSNKKTAVIYSHILNDANLFYGKDLFSGGFEEWLVETVRVAQLNQAVNWVLKVHPANVFRNAKLGYVGKYGEIVALERAFGEVPKFLRVVYPEEKISPLSFFKVCDYGITVRGTVGLELPTFGIPTLTAGTGRYSGKGFTIDSETRNEYLNKIRNIQAIPPLDPAQIELGMKYAYYIFRMRPARYGGMFRDVYRFPTKHPRHRDVSVCCGSVKDLLSHPQMARICEFLSSDEEDFLDFDALDPEIN